MFGVDTSELLLIAVVALLFIGPKDLPGAMRGVGRWVGKIRGMARHFSSGFEAVIREAELEEMDRKWREENERIMREHPMPELTGPLNPASDAQAYLERPEEPLLPLDAPAAPDDDPTPPDERPLP